MDHCSVIRQGAGIAAQVDEPSHDASLPYPLGALHYQVVQAEAAHEGAVREEKIQRGGERMPRPAGGRDRVYSP